LQIDSIHIPRTVQNLLADRIDRLPIQEKHLLQTAAVIGVIVPVRLLRIVADLPESELEEYLTHLQTAEFIYESNLFPELEYTFKHALTNEVAYGALIHDRRVFLHAKIAGALEQIAGPNLQDCIETLAQHAYRGELWDKAVAYLWQSGKKALARSANQEAREFFQLALNALEHLPESRARREKNVDLRLDLRNPLFLLGAFDQLYDCLNEAESVAASLGDQRRLGRVLNFLVSYHGLVGEHERAVVSCERNLSLNSNDVELNAVTFYYLGQAYHYLGQYSRSMAALSHALDLIRDDKYRHERFGTAYVLRVINKVWQAQCLAQLGDFAEGSAAAQAAIYLAEEARHGNSIAYAYCSLGFLLLLKGDHERAIATLEKCLRICEEAEIRVLTTHAWSHLGFAYALCGRTAEALPLLEMSDSRSAVIGRKAGKSLRTCWHGHVRLLSGDVGKSAELAAQALELAIEGKERGNEAWALKLIADVDLRNKELDNGEKHYCQAMSVANELGMKPLEAHCHAGLSRLFREGGYSERAELETSAAAVLYRQMEMGFWLEHTQPELQTDPVRS
jgi:tetratricopeptide (TPR) repeat protein